MVLLPSLFHWLLTGCSCCLQFSELHTNADSPSIWFPAVDSRKSGLPSSGHVYRHLCIEVGGDQLGVNPGTADLLSMALTYLYCSIKVSLSRMADLILLVL